MRYRQGPRQKIGVLVAVGVGVASLVLAYVRVESYVL